MALVNSFLIGADPEFAISDEGDIVKIGPGGQYSPWGIDHNGYIVEPHPKPELSVRELLKNLKVSLNDFATVAKRGKWRAEPYMAFPTRAVTTGGHVHFDIPSANKTQIAALDRLTSHLELLDILPASRCQERRNAGTGYGRLGDIRQEHGHFEYRSQPSWLFSQRVAKICLIGSKLAATEPEEVYKSLGKTAEIASLRKTFELFKGKDDDVDWVLDGGLFDKKLTVACDRDLRDVWSVEPKKEDPNWKRLKARPPVQPVEGTLDETADGDFYVTAVDGFLIKVPRDNTLSGREVLDLLPILREAGNGFRGNLLTATGRTVRVINHIRGAEYSCPADSRVVRFGDFRFRFVVPRGLEVPERVLINECHTYINGSIEERQRRLNRVVWTGLHTYRLVDVVHEIN